MSERRLQYILSVTLPPKGGVHLSKLIRRGSQSSGPCSGPAAVQAEGGQSRDQLTKSISTEVLAAPEGELLVLMIIFIRGIISELACGCMDGFMCNGVSCCGGY